MRVYLCFLLSLPLVVTGQSTCGGAQAFQILHFTETAGFDHNTRSQSGAMFTDLGVLDNYTVVNTRDIGEFNTLANLETYEVIVFANTSGNIPFTDNQRANLEAYIDGGGAVLGIHAATDMYRNGSWFYYSDLMGGSRRNSPAHTSSSYNGTMDAIGAHPTTDGLPNPYNKQEEYYYWPDTGLVAGITEVLRVRSTGGNSYDAPRPMSWYQNFVSGGRSFYTALGHARSNYTNPDNDFRLHLRNAVCWCVEAQSASLPVTLHGASLTRLNHIDRINFQLTATDLERIEFHGGPSQSATRLLGQLRGAASLTSTFTHRPADLTTTMYYRLRFVDYDGSESWSNWLAATPDQEQALPRVQYRVGSAYLNVPPNGPTAAWIVDANGRRVAALELDEGRNELPALGRGIYFIRFPFGRVSLRYLGR